MDKTNDPSQLAQQMKDLSDKQASRTKLACTFGAGITCIMAMGLAFIAHSEVGTAREARRLSALGAHGVFGAYGAYGMPYGTGVPNAPDAPHSAEREKNADAANAADASRKPIKGHRARQLEELAKYKLSDTDQQIAALILQGDTNRSIAEKMHLAESTIKKHVQLILSETGTANRKELSRIINERADHQDS